MSETEIVRLEHALHAYRSLVVYACNVLRKQGHRGQHPNCALCSLFLDFDQAADGRPAAGYNTSSN